MLALAEEIHRIILAAERLQFCALGTRATMYCQRLARSYRQKENLKIRGGLSRNQ